MNSVSFFLAACEGSSRLESEDYGAYFLCHVVFQMFVENNEQLLTGIEDNNGLV